MSESEIKQIKRSLKDIEYALDEAYRLNNEKEVKMLRLEQLELEFKLQDLCN